MPASKTKTAWKAAAVHEDITLPSGFVVDIRIPNIAAMAKAGELPSKLVEVATKAAASKEIPDDLLEQVADYHRFLVTKTVVKPTVTEEDYEDLPTEDIDMLVAFATRQQDIDAVGHHLAGLETQDSFRELRGLTSSGSDLLGM